MKKAKIMLLAITVLAVVGGALAFKAMTFTDVDLCITTPDPVHGCVGILPDGCIRLPNLSATENIINPSNFCFTVTAHELGCGNACTLSATSAFED